MSETKALVPVHTSKSGDLTLSEMKDMAQWAYKSGEFKSLKSPFQALLLMQYGRELGFGPATSLQLVYSVGGTPSLKANTIAALIKQVRWRDTSMCRYDYRVKEKSNQRCVLDFYERSDSGQLELRGSQEYTMEDAKLAGYSTKKNKDGSPNMYQRMPRPLLFARCLTEGARTYCPDCLGGIVPYTPEELGYSPPEREPASSEAIDAEFAPAPGPVEEDPSGTGITEEEYLSLQEEADSKGRNLSNLLAQLGADPNDPRGMTRSQFRAVNNLLTNL